MKEVLFIAGILIGVYALKSCIGVMYVLTRRLKVAHRRLKRIIKEESVK